MESRDPLQFSEASRHRQRSGNDSSDLTAYVRRVAIAGLAVVLLVVLWVGREVLCAVFAGILFAVLLSGLGEKLSQVTSLSRRVSVAVVLIVLLTALGGMVAAIVVYAPNVLDRVERFPVPPQLSAGLERLREQGDLLLGQSAGQLSAGTIRWGGYLLTMFFVGIFAASQPGLYKTGLLAMVPRRQRPTASRMLTHVGTSLRHWLLARAVSMVAVGVLSAPLFLFAGVPLAVPLAVFAGLLTFVPYFGPFIALVPVAVASFSAGMPVFLLATGGYLAVQTATGFIADPLLQQRMVHLPAALILTSQLLLGALIGTMGVAVAAPLALVVLVVLRELGVGRDTWVVSETNDGHAKRDLGERTAQREWSR